MFAAAVVQAAETAEAASGLTPLGFGLVSFTTFLFGLAVTYAFRSVGTRH